eukprot:XP_011670029.1 PREDICTED: transient receptor potential cation channel subfamily M member 2-like [Strongylocentrotus purpuratus]
MLLSLFRDVWNLTNPKLLISVTGGAQNFPLNRRLKDVFRKGLIKAATSTGAWIITGGIHAGVMKYVGDAVRHHNLATGRSDIVAIGIASWGVIKNREKLIDDNTSENAMAVAMMVSSMVGGISVPARDPQTSTSAASSAGPPRGQPVLVGDSTAIDTKKQITCQQNMP